MSGTIGPAGPSDYGVMGGLIANATSVRQKLDTLTEQASTGLAGDTYAGLGNGAPVSLNLRPQIAALTTWQSNINAATGQMGVAQTALTQLQSIASNFYAQLNNLDGTDSSEVDTVAAQARDALGQVADLLDTQDGGVYVFAGQDSGNPPVPDPNHILASGYYTQINSVVSTFNGVAPNDAATVTNTTFAIATSNIAGTSPFSSYLSQPAATLRAASPTVQVGTSSDQPIAIPASANGLIPDSVSTGPSITGGPPTTTGSYTRDLLRALATIGSLSSAQASDPGFQDVVQDTRVSLSGAVNAMAEDAGALGNIQSSLTATGTQLSNTQTALTTQVGSVEDVDMASTLSQLSLVQTQMQASYQLISTLGSLSLAKFLAAGA